MLQTIIRPCRTVLAREFLRTDQNAFLAGCQGIKPDFGDFGVIYFVSFFVLFRERNASMRKLTWTKTKFEGVIAQPVRLRCPKLRFGVRF